jgi:hypothetical protein
MRRAEIIERRTHFTLPGAGAETQVFTITANATRR